MMPSRLSCHVGAKPCFVTTRPKQNTEGSVSLRSHPPPVRLSAPVCLSCKLGWRVEPAEVWRGGSRIHIPWSMVFTRPICLGIRNGQQGEQSQAVGRDASLEKFTFSTAHVLPARPRISAVATRTSLISPFISSSYRLSTDQMPFRNVVTLSFFLSHL